MNKILAFEEYVVDHRVWWKHEIAKSNDYTDSFRQLINSILEEKKL